MAAEKKESWSVRVHFASEVEATKFALMPGADKPERHVTYVWPRLTAVRADCERKTDAD